MRQLVNKIRNMFRRGLILLTDDSGAVQKLQVLFHNKEVRSDLPVVQNYGFSTHPHAGAQAMTIFKDGDADQGVVIAVADARYRMKSLAQGEVVIYTDEGDKIHFKRGRIIDIETGTLNIKATSSVNIDTPAITATGALNVNSNITSQAEVIDLLGSMSTMRGQYNGHSHKPDGTPTTLME